jgi:glycosyltransferase involved in cell wall biosynthesis
MRRIARDAALRSELGARGRERALRFDWDATAQATLDVYREASRRG